MSDPSSRPAWYREWFGEEYLDLYPHRDEEEASAAVDLVLGAFGTPEGLILDLACGAGRHMIEFERRSLSVVGLDLSAALLTQARARGPGLMLVRGDMRVLPFSDSAFGTVVNFFTSFGYFADPEDDTAVLNEIRRVLRPGGCFALDFLNADRVKKNLVKRDERQLDQRRVVQERRLEEGGKVVVKAIHLFDLESDRPLNTYHERVRLYSSDELRAMLRRAGFEPQQAYGDYSGAPTGPDSPRCILLGRAS